MEVTTRVTLNNWTKLKYKLVGINQSEIDELKKCASGINESYDFIKCIYNNTVALSAYQKREYIESPFHATMYIIRIYN